MHKVEELALDTEPVIRPLQDLAIINSTPRKSRPYAYRRCSAHVTEMRSQTSSAVSSMHIDHDNESTASVKEQT